MAASDGIMSLLFGKKKRRLRSKKSTSIKGKGKVTRKKIGYCLKKKRVCHVYKYKGLKGRRYASKHKLPKGKKIYKTKAACKAAARKISKKTKKTTLRRRSKRSSFGVGGSYMPLESFMSPYPYSVSSSPPWI
jgi:hypothetical protein